jgi:hypothetical protein
MTWKKGSSQTGRSDALNESGSVKLGNSITSESDVVLHGSKCIVKVLRIGMGNTPHPMRRNTRNVERATRVQSSIEEEVGDYPNWAGPSFDHLLKKSYERLFHFFGGSDEGS